MDHGLFEVRSHVFNDEGEGLFRHQYQVTHLYQSYPGSDCWADYDITYRQHLAIHPTFQWGAPLHDLVLFSQNRGMMDRTISVPFKQSINSNAETNRLTPRTQSLQGSASNSTKTVHVKTSIHTSALSVSIKEGSLMYTLPQNATLDVAAHKPDRPNQPHIRTMPPPPQATPKRTSATNASQLR